MAVCVCLFTSVKPLFDMVSYAVGETCCVHCCPCVRVCLVISIRSLSDKVSQAVGRTCFVHRWMSQFLSVCSPQTDLCWTRSVTLLVICYCVHCWMSVCLCLSVHLNQIFVGQGQSGCVPVSVITSIRLLLDKVSQAVGHTHCVHRWMEVCLRRSVFTSTKPYFDVVDQAVGQNDVSVVGWKCVCFGACSSQPDLCVTLSIGLSGRMTCPPLDGSMAVYSHQPDFFFTRSSL